MQQQVWKPLRKICWKAFCKIQGKENPEDIVEFLCTTVFSGLFFMVLYYFPRSLPRSFAQ